MSAGKLTPEKAYARLQTWWGLKQGLKDSKQEEHLLREEAYEYYFPNPHEGVNRLDLGGGFDLKTNVSYIYKVDEAAVEQVTQAQIKKHKLPWDELFVYKPVLDKKVYNNLTAEQQKFVDALLDIKPGAVNLDIVPAADREGQAAHVAAAQQASGVPQPPVSHSGPHLVIVVDPQQAQPGQYFNDGQHWWKLSPQYEWQWLDPRASDDVIAALVAAATGPGGHRHEEEEAAPRKRRGTAAKKVAATKKTATRKRGAEA